MTARAGGSVMKAPAIALASCVVALAACGGGPKTDPRYPPREKGCAVQVFRGAVPTEMAIDDLGRVSATCSSLGADSDCIRELEDQACKLGGDVVYFVPDKPETLGDDRIRYDARFGHTRAAGAKTHR